MIYASDPARTHAELLNHKVLMVKFSRRGYHHPRTLAAAAADIDYFGKQLGVRTLMLMPELGPSGAFSLKMTNSGRKRQVKNSGL